MSSITYIYSISQLTNNINKNLGSIVQYATVEILNELEKLIRSDVYGDEINTVYNPTYQFLEAFVFSEVVNRGNFYYSSLNYNSDIVKAEIIPGSWNEHASVYGEDVSEGLYDILNVSGKTSPIGVKIRKPYLDNFIKYLDSEFDNIMERAMIKNGFPIS